ncbi:GlsB/YeaQ/YmgE family stress response membrane protein [uncultured Alistipes sp.]|jgi:hypothetical protein|uniref:GlsB/YeaQ/YmgE family stress response membrane protein n=1 Tax=uncultured Alistipes sp. TaxID=538949 RepID=UPI0025F6452A|nr:GlsB/YeaQ/YmgE family stress response membrane protein [uncultured Alistipes sp.]
MNFLWYLLIGLAAGWIGSLIFKGSGSGLIINLIVGIVGGVLGGWVFGLFGLESASIWGSLITAVVGAVLLLWIVSLFTRTKR